MQIDKLSEFYQYKRLMVSLEKHILPGVLENIQSKYGYGSIIRYVLYSIQETDSTDKDFIIPLYNKISRTMVVLDSKHTKDHVLKELSIYAPLVSVGFYLVVCDTFVENRDPELYLNHECKPGNSPFDAVHEFLKSNDNFVIDTEIDRKLLISSNYNGYLKRVK